MQSLMEWLASSSRFVNTGFADHHFASVYVSVCVYVGLKDWTAFFDYLGPILHPSHSSIWLAGKVLKTLKKILNQVLKQNTDDFIYYCTHEVLVEK